MTAASLLCQYPPRAGHGPSSVPEPELRGLRVHPAWSLGARGEGRGHGVGLGTACMQPGQSRYDSFSVLQHRLCKAVLYK